MKIGHVIFYGFGELGGTMRLPCQSKFFDLHDLKQTITFLCNLCLKQGKTMVLLILLGV